MVFLIYFCCWVYLQSLLLKGTVQTGLPGLVGRYKNISKPKRTYWFPVPCSLLGQDLPYWCCLLTQCLITGKKNLSPTDMKKLPEPTPKYGRIPFVHLPRCLLSLTRRGVSCASRIRGFPNLGHCGMVPLSGAIQPLDIGRGGYLGQTSSCGTLLAHMPGHVVSLDGGWGCQAQEGRSVLSLDLKGQLSSLVISFTCATMLTWQDTHLIQGRIEPIWVPFILDQSLGNVGPELTSVVWDAIRHFAGNFSFSFGVPNQFTFFFAPASISFCYFSFFSRFYSCTMPGRAGRNESHLV